MKIKQFKLKRSQDLVITADVLDKVFLYDVDTEPIRRAANSLLKDKNEDIDENYWRYKIENLTMPVRTTKHLVPKQVKGKNLLLTLDMSIVADYREWENLSDPLVDLNFKVTIRGVGDRGSHFMCFHLDRHDLSKEANEPHPTYHIQYSNNPEENGDFDYGNTLLLDTPRLAHHPLEFILGIGFLTSNFYPSAFEKIMDESYFPGLYRRYQERILKPYYHTMASYWAPYDHSKIVMNSKDLCPILI